MGRAAKRRKTKDFFFRFASQDGVKGIFHTEAKSFDEALQKFLRFVAATGVKRELDDDSTQAGGLLP